MLKTGDIIYKVTLVSVIYGYIALTIRMRTRAVESDYIDVSLKYMQNILNESFLMK